MIIIIKLILFILTIIGLIVIWNRIKQFYNKEEENLQSTYEEPHIAVFPILLFSLWLLWKYKYLFLNVFVSKLLATILFWSIIFGVIVMLILAGIVYYKMYGQYWNNEKMLGAQRLKYIIPRTLIISGILYVHLYSTSPTMQTYLLIAWILYHCCEKIYIRIFKAVDFADESDDQQDQTRLNNKILALFLIWIFIWFCVGQPIMYYITAGYLLILANYYNIPLPVEEKYPVIKAPRGSPERDELFWEACHAIEEAPIDVQVIGGLYMEELEEQEQTSFFDWGYDGDSLYNESDPKHNIFCSEKDEEIMYDEAFLENMQIKLSELRNFDRYVERKVYAVHEYYFWWLMKNVPFYFGIKAVFDMLWDLFWILFRAVWIFYFSVLVVLFALYSQYRVCEYPDIIAVMLEGHVAFSLFSLYIMLLYMATPDLKKPYSWLAFYYKNQAYALYDFIHPYALYGPTVDGPRNWQYWFFIFFGYLPSRGLILLPELFAEEIRVTEESIRLDMWEADKAYHPDEVAGRLLLWNPLVWYRMRNASPAEKEAFREKILRETKLKVEQLDEKKYLKYLTKPKWWTHYAI